MTSTPTHQLRTRFQRLHRLMGGRYWFPHVPLAILLGLGGFWLLRSSFGAHWVSYAKSVVSGEFHVQLSLLPTLLIGGGMLTMALGLLWRSRLAWIMAVLLAATGTINTVLARHHHDAVLLAYFVFILASLLLAWRHFDRSSVAASTLLDRKSVV